MGLDGRAASATLPVVWFRLRQSAAEKANLDSPFRFTRCPGITERCCQPALGVRCGVGCGICLSSRRAAACPECAGSGPALRRDTRGDTPGWNRSLSERGISERVAFLS